MTRRARRDPRSLLEVRRLAYRAARSSEAREVLHDVLLETFPGRYMGAISDAERYAHEDKVRYAVIFKPDLLTKRRIGIHSLFEIIELPMTNAEWLAEKKTHYVLLGKNAVIVYRTRGAL